MKLDLYNNPVFQENDILELLYQQNIPALENLLVEDTDSIKDFYNRIDVKYFLPSEPISVADYDTAMQSNWFIPDEYKQINISEYLLNKCSTNVEVDRVVEEMQVYTQKGLIPLLQTLKYIIDTMRDNNIVWGVGRGSSVSSYVLYLLGVHKIDSLKYNLDYKEFLR